MEIVSAEPEDLPAIGRLHEHFWGERSDVSAMAQTLWSTRPIAAAVSQALCSKSSNLRHATGDATR